MVVRDDSLKKTVSEYLVDRIRTTPEIQVLFRTEVIALHGGNVWRAVTLRNNQTGQERTVETSWLFLCLGGVPHTQWAAEVGIIRDEGGYLVTSPDLLKKRKASEELDACPRAVLSRDKYSRCVRGRRCAARFDEAMRFSGW
jgi:thioredoxin reductase (NADPH)